MINVDYPALLKLFPQHLAPKRSESASFLIWYLENYYRLDTLEAVDSVCDQRGDKGVDGIFVNDNDQTITIFQSRISQSKESSIGDTGLKELVGTLRQFESIDAIQNLITTAGNAQVATLLKRLDIINKVATHEVRGEYLSNINIDRNGTAYLATVPNLTVIGKDALLSTYISDTRDIPDRTVAKFDIHGFRATEYIVDADTKAVIAPIKAIELVAMDGIADQSLFAFNVRGPLGRTQVNRDIVKSIGEVRRHKLFPLFHNGITIIARDVQTTADVLQAQGYFVVNGCQSLTALYNNKDRLTDDLRVLVKFIKMDPASKEAELITQFSNNQNSTRARDFKANNPIQIRLQNEFTKFYDGQYNYEIKRGEPEPVGTKISNEEAGLLLRAFDLREPWATHRKYEVFEDKYADIFGRPAVTADRIVLCEVIKEAIDEALPQIANQLLARYVLTRYAILFIVRDVLENDQMAAHITDNPKKFVRAKGDREHFKKCIARIVGDLIVDLNDEVKELGDDFDYRDKLRDADWVKKLSTTIVADHRKLVGRGRIPSFKDDWESNAG